MGVGEGEIKGTSNNIGQNARVGVSGVSMDFGITSKSPNLLRASVRICSLFVSIVCVTEIRRYRWSVFDGFYFVLLFPSTRLSLASHVAMPLFT
jgi:hypothetical protein